MWKSNASASFGVWFLRPINGDSAWAGEAKACLDLKQHLLGGKSSKFNFGGFGQRPVKTAQCLDYNFNSNVSWWFSCLKGSFQAATLRFWGHLKSAYHRHGAIQEQLISLQGQGPEAGSQLQIVNRLIPIISPLGGNGLKKPNGIWGFTGLPSVLRV